MWESLKAFSFRSPIETVITDLEGRVLFFNPAFQSFLAGPSRQKVVIRSIMELFEKTEKEKAYFILHRLREEKEKTFPSVTIMMQGPTIARKVKATLARENITGVPELRDTHETEHTPYPFRSEELVIWRLQDLSEVDFWKKEVAQTSRLLQMMQENISDIIYVKNQQGDLLFCNFAFRNYFGEVSGRWKDDKIFAHSTQRKLYFSKVQNGLQVQNEKVLFKNSHGKVFWGLLNITSNSSEEEQLSYTVSITDIQEQVTTKLKYNQILEQANSAIILASDDNKINYFNHASERLFGISREKVLTHDLQKLLPQSIIDRLHTLLHTPPGPRAEMLKGIFEIELKKVNGKNFWGSVSINAFQMGTEGQLIIFISDVTERITFNKLLAEKNEALKKTNQQLDAFLYSAFHDLRSPLTTLLGLANIMEMKDEHPDFGKFGGMISKTVKKLDRVLMDMISFSKNSKARVQSDPLPITPLIEEIWAEINQDFDLSRFEIHQEINENRVLYSDKDRLQIIIKHLLKNALQFSDTSKTPQKINIIVDVDQKGMQLEIQDNGIGIPANRQQKIFDMFYRGTEISKGSGLGLYLVAETIEKLGGSIEVSSEIGHGSTFRVFIPNGLKALLRLRKESLK